MKKIMVLFGLLVSFSASSDSFPAFITAADALKSCVDHEVDKLGANPVFSDKVKGHISDKCFFPVSNLIESCKATGEKTEKECIDISTKLLGDYYKHAAVLSAPETAAKISQPKANGVIDVYWSQTTAPNGNPVVIRYTSARSKNCPADGFWHYAHIQNEDTKGLCWKQSGNVAPLTLLNVSAGARVLIYQPGIVPGGEREMALLNKQWQDAEIKRSNQAVEVMRQQNPELFTK